MNEDAFEKIDKYLNGEMSREERLLFQAEIARDEELSSAVNIYRVIEKEMSENEKYDDGELSLKNTLEELNNRYFNNETREGLSIEENKYADILKSKEKNVIKKITADEPVDLVKVRKIRPWMRVAVAASIIGIIALGVTWYLEKAGNSNVPVANKITVSSKKANNKDTSLPDKNVPANDVAQKNEEKDKTDTVSPAALYADNFKPDAAPADKEGPLENAFIYYQHKRYTNAITAINNADLTLVTRGEGNSLEVTAFYARYYKALSYMATKNMQKAIPELNSAIANSTDQLFKVKAQWYLSLAYINEGDLKKAEEYLRLIAGNKESSIYKTKAQKLIDEVKRLK